MYFCAYVDPYGRRTNGTVQYYAYFSSFHGNQNDYNHFFTLNATAYPGSDCASLGVWPYATSATTGTSAKPQYVKPNSWQIICAGQDGVFGPGTDFSAQPGTQFFWSK